HQADDWRRRAATIVGAAHVIDDGGQPDLAQFRLDREEVVVAAEHLNDPAKLADAVEGAAHSVEARRELEASAEIEPRAADAGAVQPGELHVADAVIDDGDAAIFPL